MGGANHKHSQGLSSEVIALSPSTTQISETPPRNPRLGTSPYNPCLHVHQISSHASNSDSGAQQASLPNSDSGTPPNNLDSTRYYYGGETTEGKNPDSGDSPHNLDSTRYYCAGETTEGKTPNWRLRGACSFAAALLDSTDDSEGEGEEREGEGDELPAKDGGISRTEKFPSSRGTDSLSASTEGEPSMSTSASICTNPPLLFDSGESVYM